MTVIDKKNYIKASQCCYLAVQALVIDPLAAEYMHRLLRH